MFRFTIRDGLWLMVVAALIAVWRGDLARQQKGFDNLLRETILKNSGIIDAAEAKSLIDKARRDPQLRAELKTIGIAEKQYSNARQILHNEYRGFFERARKLH